MNEEVQFIVDSAKENMDNAIAHLESEFLNIRAGKATPSMLNGVKVEYYGALTPLTQVANVNTLDAHTITIQPWEKQLIPEIEKGIMTANLGFNPMNNGESVIINVPILTEERRKSLVINAQGKPSRLFQHFGRPSNHTLFQHPVTTATAQQQQPSQHYAQ